VELPHHHGINRHRQVHRSMRSLMRLTQYKNLRTLSPTRSKAILFQEFIANENCVSSSMSCPCGKLPKTHSSLLSYVAVLLLIVRAAAICGQVQGVLCNGGNCVAGSCQCPSHLVGTNWSVFECVLSSLLIACALLFHFFNICIVSEVFFPCAFGFIKRTSGSEYACPGPISAPCNMNGMCNYDVKAIPSGIELPGNCSCSQAFRVIRFSLQKCFLAPRHTFEC
jgi:hypothetical protein